MRDEAPLSVNEATRLVALVTLVQELAQQPNMILRFCALRALAKTDTSAKPATKSNIVPWKLTVAMRAQGSRAPSGFAMPSCSSSWHASGLRRSNARHSPKRWRNMRSRPAEASQ